MRYQKFKADLIFDGYRFRDSPDTVLITDESGKILDLLDETEAGDGIRSLNGMICPGFVNAHCHIELSHLKGCIEPGTGLVEFVQQVLRSRTSNSEIKLSAMQSAADELYRTGTVAVGDICNTTDSIELKKNSPLYWHNFVEVSGFVEATALNRYQAALDVIAQMTMAGIPPASVTLAAHAPYSVSAPLFRLINEHTRHQVTTIHNQECAAENEFYRQKTGDFLGLYKNLGIDISPFVPSATSSFEYWYPYYNHQQRVIAVHNTFMAEQDLAFYTNHQNVALYFCLCVNANRYIENRFPPEWLVKTHGYRLLIGTDSYASNEQLNMLEEIKQLSVHFGSAVPLKQWLKSATINGATALNRSDSLGSFEQGKTPGVVLIDGLENNLLTRISTAQRII